MCEGSIHVPHRLATKTERLVVQKIPDMGNMKGYYPATVRDAKLVCCRGTIEAVIKQVRFEKGLPAHSAGAWEGKCNVKVTLKHRPYADCVIFSDGFVILLASLKDGTRIDIGVPVKKRVIKPKSKGMLAVEGAVREALALPPDPKPEDEPAQPAAPAEPEREPAPASDAPAARRRVRS